jgi:hypothetical protein
MFPRARRDLPQKRGQQPPAAAVLLTIMLVAAIVLVLPSLAADAGVAGADLRSGDPLPAGSRQLDQIAYAERGKDAAKF